MKSSQSRVLLLASLVAAALASGACASLEEKTRSAAETTNNFGNKIDNSIRRGIASGNSAADSAVKAAAAPIDRAAKKIGLPGGPPPSGTADRTGGN